jgi:hypothetical protein
MNTTEALKLVGGLSKPSKMPGWAYGIPAAECKTGKKLQDCTWAQRAKNVMPLKAVTCFRLCRQLNIEDWRQLKIHYGLKQWLL